MSPTMMGSPVLSMSPALQRRKLARFFAKGCAEIRHEVKLHNPQSFRFADPRQTTVNRTRRVPTRVLPPTRNAGPRPIRLSHSAGIVEIFFRLQDRLSVS